MYKIILLNQKNLEDLARVLLKIKDFEKEYEIEMPLFLHGGESFNSLFNSNLIDALLLNTKRIGHGLNLTHHS
jgi:adenosine deaminase CECR1